MGTTITTGDGARLNRATITRLARDRERLLAYITPRVGSRELAEDVLHAAYVRAIERGGGLRSDEKALAWFRMVLRNLATDQLRRLGASRRAVETWSRDVDGFVSAPDDTPGQTCRCVSHRLPLLRGSYADVLRRVDMDHQPISVVDRELGATPNNIRVRLHRARAALRRELKDFCGADAKRGCHDCPCLAPTDASRDAMLSPQSREDSTPSVSDSTR